MQNVGFGHIIDLYKTKLGAPMGLRATKKQKLRSDLIAASNQLFKDQGFTATTLEAIAKKIPITSRTLIREFGSKENLAVGLLTDLNQTICEAFDQRPQAEEVITSLAYAAKATATRYETNREQVAFTYSLVKQFSGVSDALHASYGRLSDLLASAITKRLSADAATAHRPLVLAMAACAILRKAIDVWMANGPVTSFSDIVDQGFEFFRDRPKPERFELPQFDVYSPPPKKKALEGGLARPDVKVWLQDNLPSSAHDVFMLYLAVNHYAPSPEWPVKPFRKKGALEITGRTSRLLILDSRDHKKLLKELGALKGVGTEDILEWYKQQRALPPEKRWPQVEPGP